jgi:hypothetical protein
MSGSNAAPYMGKEMRAVRRELAGASDQRVLDVLRFVDNLNDRSQADGLLAPLRERLRALRPPRPLRFARLLFEPLGPAMVNAADWRAGRPALPRSAVPPVLALVRRALPAVVPAVEAIIAEAELPEADRMASAGRLLWGKAGDVLAGAEAPPEWRAISLPEGVFGGLAAAAALVLNQAWPLVELADPSVPDTEVNQTVSAMLTAAERAGPLAWGMLLTVLLQRFPASDAPARAAGAMRMDKAMREAAEAAMDAAWGWIEAATADIGLGDPADAAAVARRQVALLEELSQDPANRRRTTELQGALRAACAARFEAGVKQRLLKPMESLSAAEAADSGMLGILESDARALRRLDVDSRRLGCGAAYDARLAEAAAAITARADIPPVDRARLVEILRGPQAAGGLWAG